MEHVVLHVGKIVQERVQMHVHRIVTTTAPVDVVEIAPHIVQVIVMVTVTVLAGLVVELDAETLAVDAQEGVQHNVQMTAADNVQILAVPLAVGVQELVQHIVQMTAAGIAELDAE